MAAPLIEVADCTESGNNTATTSWAVSYPAYVSGDLLCFHVASDANVTHDWSATGPNGETVVTISDSYGGTAQRISAFYFVGSATTGAGTFTVTPSATEQWTAVVIKVPTGEFDSTTPVQATIGSANVTTAAADLATPTWTAGAKKDGRIVVAAAIDTLTTSAAPTGWTALIQRDRGAVGIMVGVRDAATTASESIASATFTKTSETHSVIGYVINDPIETFSGSGTPSLPLITSSGSGESGPRAEGGDPAPFPHLGLLLAASATFSGSGTPTLPLLTATGSASRGLKASGTPSLPLLTATGAGTKARKGDGTPTIPLVTATGSGTKARKGDGTSTLPLLTASGAGTKARKGTGTPTLPLLTADGTGSTESAASGGGDPAPLPHLGLLLGPSAAGSGGATLPLITASGTGTKSRKGTGTPTLPLLTASGTGTKARKGDGSPSIPLVTASGSGTKARKGTGTPSLPLLTATGSAKRGLTGTGTPNLPLPTASGSGTVTPTGGGGDPAPFPHLGLLLGATEGNNGSGSPNLPLITASGEGTTVARPVSSIQTISRRNRPGRGPYSLGDYYRPPLRGDFTRLDGTSHSGSGSPSLPIISAEGSAKRALKSTGTATLPLVTASGSGTKARKGTGTPTLPLITASGSGKKGRSGTGSSTLPLITASGTGQSTEAGSHTGTGSPSLPLLTASGAAKRSLISSGSPNLPLLTASGTAKRALLGSGSATLPVITSSGAGTGPQVAEPPRDPMLGGGPTRDERKKFKDWLKGLRTHAGSGKATLPVLTASGDGLVVRKISEPFQTSEAVRKPLLRLPVKKKPVEVPVDIDALIAKELRYAEELEAQKRKKRRKQDEEILLLM